MRDHIFISGALIGQVIMLCVCVGLSIEII